MENNNEMILKEDIQLICDKFLAKNPVNFAIKCQSLEEIENIDYVGCLENRFGSSVNIISNK